MATIAGSRPAVCQDGLTSLELMIALAIAAVLLCIGAPSMMVMVQAQRLTVTVNDFLAAIHLARAEAVRRGERVDLVPADGSDWSAGWTIFVNRSGNRMPGAEDALVFRGPPLPTRLRIASTFTDAAHPYLAFAANGRTRTDASVQQPQAGSISFALDGRIRKIKLNFQGRARICDPAAEPATC
ncbi:prepilin-type N-terminal cleavage/methylation domain-containing protein [Noviherbaspirillum sp. 17J57-3]|uniref:Type II secretion system protein H n=2 Tax=Noviherbaspirillum galbum TaxID=2709383 RepID=A0A6B3SHU1_9BURK|nr:prepilin-type N-terminal cleavage/methylation domain-containing protein [Noviherbaspirillum galbum]